MNTPLLSPTLKRATNYYVRPTTSAQLSHAIHTGGHNRSETKTTAQSRWLIQLCLIRIGEKPWFRVLTCWISGWGQVKTVNVARRNLAAEPRHRAKWDKGLAATLVRCSYCFAADAIMNVFALLMSLWVGIRSRGCQRGMNVIFVRKLLIYCPWNVR